MSAPAGSLSEQEAKALYAIHGDLLVHFDHYYKYTFYFEGENDRLRVEGAMGGSHSNIYRAQVDRHSFRATWGEVHGLSDWTRDLACWHWLKVTDKATGEVYEAEEWP